MTKIYALQKAEMVGDILDGTAEWFCNFLSPHTTKESAMIEAVYMLDEVRDADLKFMRAEYPQDNYNEADYNIINKAATKNSDVLELVRRCGVDQIPLSQMVITKSEIHEWA
jgi:hypothetical protein